LTSDDARQSIETMLSNARAARHDGRAETALRLYVEAADAASEPGAADVRLHALRHVSALARAAGDHRLALDAGLQAVALARDLPSAPLERSNALRVAALALEANDDRAEALPLWREARQLYSDADIAAGVAECDSHLADASA
jgi:tetratricopeptide (TPR) repeat protein